MTFDTSQRETSASWDRRKIKFHLCGFFGGGTPSKDNLDYWTDGTVPWVTPKDMKRRMIDTAEDLITVDAVKNSATNMVPPSSVLMVVRSGILKHSLPVALNTVPVALNQDMKAFRFRRSLLPDFFAYWIEGQQKQKLFEWCQIGATVDNINVVAMLNGQIAVPDLATQRQIADFLDRETARIDLLIEKKQRLVALLGEKYFAHLESLTFPDDTPADELVPFRWICRVAEGQVDPTSEMWRDRMLIAPNHIESKTGRLLATETAEDQGAISGKYAFGKGTVLYSKIRPALAKACIAPSSGMCSADMYPIIPDKRLRSEYLLMQLLSARFTDWATLESMRVAMPKINRETLGGFRLRVPPIASQDQYVQGFAVNRAQFEAVTDKINASIDRLKEYRSALITAAVTGQIDVSTYAKSGTPDRRLNAIQEEMGA